MSSKMDPLQKLVLRENDVVVAIDGVSTKQYTTEDAALAIRGPRGSTVELEIFRPATENIWTVSIVRKRVEMPTVETKVLNDVFVIRLKSFTMRASEEITEALGEFVAAARSRKTSRILLDMRDNQGGILVPAVEIASIFLPADTIVLYVHEEARPGRLKAYLTSQSALEKKISIPMTILVNEGTASAAEVLVAALHYYGIADVVGAQTYGKGSMQEMVRFRDSDFVVKMTTARWFTPAKRSIEEIGIVPDVDYQSDSQRQLWKNPRLNVEEYLFSRALEHVRTKK